MLIRKKVRFKIPFTAISWTAVPLPGNILAANFRNALWLKAWGRERPPFFYDGPGWYFWERGCDVPVGGPFKTWSNIKQSAALFERISGYVRRDL